MFHCQDKEIEKTLKKLKKEVSKHNAWFHPSLQITEENTNLSVSASPPGSAQEILLQIPESCLPPIEQFTFTVQNDSLVIQEIKENLPESQKHCCELMIELYNKCRKLEEFKSTSPWFAFAEFPEFLEYIIEGRQKAPKVAQYHQLWEQGHQNKILVDGFLGRRYFGLKSNGKSKQEVLLPFVDFLNHHSAAPGFRVSSDENHKQTLWTHNSQPEPESQECLVKYTQLDPLDSLLIYGFVDESSRICRSIPLEITFSQGVTLTIESRITLYQGRLPQNVQDLKFYIPQFIAINNNSVTLSHLLIPGPKAPYALRRVLAFVLSQIHSGRHNNDMSDMVNEAEAEIIFQNFDYYTKLLTSCYDNKGSRLNSNIELVKDVAVRQKNWIKMYDNRLGLGCV